jgi:hypothetical protein
VVVSGATWILAAWRGGRLSTAQVIEA